MFSSQRITSADTSLNQVPALMRWVEWIYGTRNLDFGGGKYDTATAYLDSLGVTSLVYDPFNRTPTHNSQVVAHFLDYPADTATLANVLNVISEPHVRQAVLAAVKVMVKPGAEIYISCYRGVGNTPGPTSKGWQENRPIGSYLSEVRRIFPQAKLVDRFIAARH